MSSETVERLIAELVGFTKAKSLSAPRTRSEYQLEFLRHATLVRGTAMNLLAELGPEAYLDEPRILEALDDSPHEYDRGGQEVSTRGMMDRLTHVPDYLDDMQSPAREAVKELEAAGPARVSKVKVYGVGGSAAPAAMAKEIIENSGCLGYEFEILRCDTPRLDNVADDTLLIFSSFSGDTEEILQCLDCATKPGRARGPMIAMSRGGRLEERAKGNGIPWIGILPRVRQPRESVGLQLTAVLTVLSELKLPSGSSNSPFTLTPEMVKAAQDLVGELTAEVHHLVPFKENKAKQAAVRLLYGDEKWGAGRGPVPPPRIPIVLSDTASQAAAFEFYTQLCEASKVVCHVAACPEAFHNLVEAMKFSLASPRNAPWSVYFIESGEDDSARVLRRWQCTLKEIFPDLKPYSLAPRGSTPFERCISAYYFNAWVRLYVAFLNGAEPLPVPTMGYMKEFMGAIPRP